MATILFQLKDFDVGYREAGGKFIEALGLGARVTEKRVHRLKPHEQPHDTAIRGTRHEKTCRVYLG
jgi:hypothetical protein